MKLIRFTYRDSEAMGVLKDGTISVISGSPFSNFIITDDTIPIGTVKILPPVQPSKIICVGKNYAEHAKELNSNVPPEPLIFLKPNTSIIAPEEYIVLPPSSKRVDYEGELAVVIKKKCKNVKKEEALDYILGYTCLNDVTARDIQQREGKFTRAKSFDTFAPLGPVIETDGRWDSFNIKTYLNGELKQSGNTGNMIFGLPVLIEFISSIMTLLEGDVISTGTPPGVGPMKKGDVVEIEIDGIGELRNYVA